MDFADIGSEATEAATSEAIYKARMAAAQTPSLKPSGVCHNPNCGEDLPKQVFCGKACRDEYEYLQKRKR